VAAGLWRWKPGPPKFYPLPGESNGVQGLGEGEDGALLIATRSGIKRLVDGKIEAHPLPGHVPEYQAHRLLRDNDGSLWIGTADRGVVHVHQGRTDVFSRSDGLSGDDVSALFQDREGNMWVSTRDGLDHFRDFAVPTFSVSQGLSNARVTSVLAAKDGSVWLGTYDGLNRWNHGKVTVYRDGGRSGLPDQRSGSLFQDDGGRIWMSTLRGAGYLENDRYVSVPGVSAGQMYSIAGDATGNV
jgi:ligand-binding sensor domain-containing protein